MCFTTGRGSVPGSTSTTSLGPATNCEVYRRRQDDMDLDCGIVLDGVGVQERGRRVFERVLAVGSGDEEFQPWQPGAVT